MPEGRSASAGTGLAESRRVRTVRSVWVPETVDLCPTSVGKLLTASTPMRRPHLLLRWTVCVVLLSGGACALEACEAGDGGHADAAAGATGDDAAGAAGAGDGGGAEAGAGGGATGETDSCTTDWPAPDPATIEADRLDSHMQHLQYEVGRFVDGSVPVFVGSVRASDTRGQWDGVHGDGALDTTSAVAFLETTSWPGPGLQLVIVDSVTGRTVALRQLDETPGKTSGSLVLDCLGSSYSFPSSCAGCIAGLDPAADAITIDELVLPGTWFNGGQQADLTVEVALDRVEPAAVTFDQLTALGGAACNPNGVGAAYALVDGDLVRSVEGYWSAGVSAPGCSESCKREDAWQPDGVSVIGGCTQDVAYTAKAFLTLSDPTRRGLLDETPGEPTVCCSYADPCGGAALFSRCWPD